MKPILVMLSWRGGARLTRCLKSIAPALPYFSRVLLSSTSAFDSDDANQIKDFARAHAGVEAISTGVELPTMQHQRFWINHLIATGANADDMVFWLAYDDEVRISGLHQLVGARGHWPVMLDTVYLGPWALRHESPAQLWSGIESELLESWTCLPLPTTRMPLLTWIAEQLRQPTYLQMSGSVMPLRAHADLVMRTPVKAGPMRIEMATAVASGAAYVAEFAEPLTIIYGRSDSDRASYGSAARAEDIDLVRRIGRYVARNPSQAGRASRFAWTGLKSRLLGSSPVAEEWRIRGTVIP